MYKITINGATFPKVTEFKTTESKLGRRFKTKQLNGVEYSILISEINKMEIEREDIETEILDGNTGNFQKR